MPSRGRRRCLVRRRRGAALSRNDVPDPGAMGKGARHSRCLVRFRLAPMPSSSNSAPISNGRPMSISKAPTSIAAGSIPRCSKPAARGAGRLTMRCITHGFTVAEDGRKMSKSLGNLVVPAGRDQAVGRRHPAPVGRLRRLCRRSAHRARNPQDQCRGLPQAAQHHALYPGRARRAQGLGASTAKDMPELERYILHRLHELDAQVRQAYRGLSTSSASVRAAQQFHERRSLGLLFRYPQGLALLRSVVEPAPPRLPHA